LNKSVLSYGEGFMFCGNCGTKLDEGSKFCMNCGCAVPAHGVSQPGYAAGKPAEVSGIGNVPNIPTQMIPQPVMPRQYQSGSSINRAVTFLLVFLILSTIPALIYWFWNSTGSWVGGVIILQIMQIAGYAFGIVACVKLKDVARETSIAALVLFVINACIEAYYLFQEIR
jgi:hypothetical protein